MYYSLQSHVAGGQRERGEINSFAPASWRCSSPKEEFRLQDNLGGECNRREKKERSKSKRYLPLYLSFRSFLYCFSNQNKRTSPWSFWIIVLTSGFLAVVSSSKGIPEKKPGKLTIDSMILWILVKLLFTKSSDMCLCILSRFYSYIQWEESHEACLFYLNWNLNLLFYFIFNYVKQYEVPKPKLWAGQTLNKTMKT